MQLRKQDIDPEIMAQLPERAFVVPLAWAQAAALAGILALGGIASLAPLFASIAINVAVAGFVAGLFASFCIAVVTVRAIERYQNERTLVVPAALRKFAKKRKDLDSVMREYCRTVACLAETSVVSEETARQMLADVNLLLAAYQQLTDEKVPREVRTARQESTRQTFRALRDSLKKIHDAIKDPVPSPTTRAVDTLDSTGERLHAHVRNLEQAAHEVQFLRH